ncbi:hypothetical protein ACEQUB_p00256 (plasmid) [Ralstonia syzygii]
MTWPPVGVEGWVGDGKRGMENALRANLLALKEHDALTGTPASASFRKPMICPSADRFFMSVSLSENGLDWLPGGPV